MRKRTLSLLTVVCALCLVFFACRKEIHQIIDPESTNVPADQLEAAKIWNAKFIAKNIAENTKQADFVMLNPLWEKAWTVSNTQGKFYIAVPTALDHIAQMRVTVSRLFLFEMHGINVIEAQIVEFIGLNYNVERNIDLLINNNQSQSITAFDGAIIHYDLNYRWSGGRIFENGAEKFSNAAITLKETFTTPASAKKAPLYLSTLLKDANGTYQITNYQYLFIPSGRLRIYGDGSGNGSGNSSGVASGLGGDLSGLTVPGGGTPIGGGGSPGGYPPSNGGSSNPPSTPTAPDISNVYLPPLDATALYQYPKFQALVNDLPNFLKKYPNILSAIAYYSGFTEAQIKQLMQPGKGPKVVPVANLKDSNGYTLFGRFNAQNKTLEINANWMNGFESAQSEKTIQATGLLLLITTLHEFVHYGRNNNKLSSTIDGNEAGWTFEMNIDPKKTGIDKNNAVQWIKYYPLNL